MDQNDSQPPRRRERPPRGKDGAARAAAPGRVPKIPEALMEALARHDPKQSGRGPLRQRLVSVIYQASELPEAEKDAAKELLGRMARAGRDLAAPMEATRHRMLHYIDTVLCGNEFLRNDPVGGGAVRNAKAASLVRLLTGWQRQLQRHVDAHPRYKMSVAEAMGMPEDGEETD